MLKVLASGGVSNEQAESGEMVIGTDASTLENSEVGDITKLSLVLDQEMRCWMVLSSSILR